MSLGQVESKKKLVIFWGATGNSKVLREALSSYKEYELIALFDNNFKVKSPFEDVPIYYGIEQFEQWYEKNKCNRIYFSVAIGGDKGRDRVEIQEFLIKKGLHPLTIVHTNAFVATNAVLGSGSQIMANASVCVDVKLGKGCIVNTASSVDHECILEEGVHVCPGAHIAGCVEVGKYAMIGAGAVVLPWLKIGEGAIIGAGAVITKNVPSYSIMVGNPARQLKKVIKA